jgi:hypothetical protein
VFARILDKDKGGHFSITPTIPFSVKQNYLPASNVRLGSLMLDRANLILIQILQTKFMNEQGVASVTGMTVFMYLLIDHIM